MNWLKLLESMLGLVIQQALDGLKIDEGFKKFIDKQLDEIENAVGKTGIDALIVLPLCDTLRKILNVPDEDVIIIGERDLKHIPYFNLPKELYAKYHNSVVRARRHFSNDVPSIAGWEFIGTFVGIAGGVPEANDYFTKIK